MDVLITICDMEVIATLDVRGNRLTHLNCSPSARNFLLCWNDYVWEYRFRPSSYKRDLSYVVLDEDMEKTEQEGKFLGVWPMTDRISGDISLVYDVMRSGKEPETPDWDALTECETDFIKEGKTEEVNEKV